MTRVGWLGDEHDWQGGAELTMVELAAAAPDGVEIVPCLPGAVENGLDRYVAGNVVTYSMEDLASTRGAACMKFVHDCWPHGDPQVRAEILKNWELTFCSPAHVERFPYEIEGEPHVIPPPIDLARFRKVAGHQPAAKREGTCWMGMAFYGKGITQAEEWAARNGPVDFYGMGPMLPRSPALPAKGFVPYEQVPQVLADYERFLFLPTHFEPFGRTVVEAWAAGCSLVVNRNLGCLHYIENEPEKLDTAAEDFWELVCG